MIGPDICVRPTGLHYVRAGENTALYHCRLKPNMIDTWKLARYLGSQSLQAWLAELSARRHNPRCDRPYGFRINRPRLPQSETPLDMSVTGPSFAGYVGKRLLLAPWQACLIAGAYTKQAGHTLALPMRRLEFELKR